MKNIICKIFLLLAIMHFATSYSKAQLPLLQGDAVVTHSPNNNSGGISAGNIVLRTAKTNNTSSAPLGANWNTATMVPAGLKPNNWNATNWTFQNLGSIFGITLDDQPQPNIYVSSSQIYSGSATNASKIWRLNGNTGAHTLVYDFANTSKSLGNLKYFRTPSTENIYVSNWDDGKIHRLTGNSASASLWAISTPFNPKFGLAVDDPTLLPYGLAIRNMSGGAFRLYYSKINTNVAPYSGNQIYSVDIDVAGAFLPATETLVTTPAIATNQPIADIAFTSNGKNMLVGQQTWYGFAALSAHQSSVVEFTFVTGNTWAASANAFPSGKGAGVNCVGGVSYSNNILQGNSLALACDTTAYFTADYIRYSDPAPYSYVYGMQGMKRGLGNSLTTSLWIDQDDNITTNADKMQLGDIEVYKKPINCVTCGCGKWASAPTLGDIPIPAVSSVLHPDLSTVNSNKIKQNQSLDQAEQLQLPVTYPLQFIQGNVVGIINAVYNCTGDCGATYSWQITAVSGVSIASGNSLPINLSEYNSKFTCGKYVLTIKAKCGDSNCESLTIPITIICEPPSCCKADITIKQTAASFNIVNNLANPNAFSIGSSGFNIATTTPMSEVRVSVEEFRLSASSPNCLNCNNRPVTWGNILAANVNAQPMTLSGYVGPTTGSIAADYREAVLSSTSPIFLNPATLNIKLSLPTITELSCCEVKVYLCLKFTFKDLNCNECVKMVCGEFILKPPTGGHGVTDVLPADKSKIKIFNIEH